VNDGEKIFWFLFFWGPVILGMAILLDPHDLAGVSRFLASILGA
jgi:hypothetical protein